MTRPGISFEARFAEGVKDGNEQEEDPCVVRLRPQQRPDASLKLFRSFLIHGYVGGGLAKTREVRDVIKARIEKFMEDEKKGIHPALDFSKKTDEE